MKLVTFILGLIVGTAVSLGICGASHPTGQDHQEFSWPPDSTIEIDYRRIVNEGRKGHAHQFHGGDVRVGPFGRVLVQTCDCGAVVEYPEWK